MTSEQLKDRTKQLALRVMKLVDNLPNTIKGRAIANQIIRSATSVGANYRATCRVRSRTELVSKIEIVEEEADETAFWLELIVGGGLRRQKQMAPFLGEANERVAIRASSRKSAIANRRSAMP
jgi:four helix bundle protein